jgi:hypothetical protein
MWSGWRRTASASSILVAALLATACLPTAATTPPPIVPTVDDPLVFLEDLLEEASSHPERLGRGQRRAVTFHRRAKEHLANDDWQGAVEALAQAYEQLRDYETAASLGATMLVLGRFHEAASYLDEARRMMPSAAPPVHREKVVRYLDWATQHTARLTIRSADGDAEATLFIDGRFEGYLPLERVVYLDEGQHRFDVKLRRRQSRTVVRVRRGEDATVELAPLPAISFPPREDRPFAPIVYATVVGTGVAAAIAGGVLVGISAKLDRDARDLADEIAARTGSLACPGEAPSCAQLGWIEGRSDRYLSAGVPLLVSGSALTAVFTTLLVTSGDGRADIQVGAGTSIHPVIAADVAALSVEGSF